MRRYPIPAFSRSFSSCFYTVSAEKCICIPVEESKTSTPSASPSRASTLSTPEMSSRSRYDLENDELFLDLCCPLSEVRNELELLVEDVAGLLSHAIVNMYTSNLKLRNRAFTTSLDLEASILSNFMWLNISKEMELDDR